MDFHRINKVATTLLLVGSTLTVGGCSVPKMLQEPFEQGVYEDIMERQAEGVPVADEKLEKLPSMTAADYEKLGDTYLGRARASVARTKYEKALELDWSEVLEGDRIARTFATHV